MFIAATLGFIACQIHLTMLHLSIPLVAITLLDLVVLALAVHAYSYRRRHQTR